MNDFGDFYFHQYYEQKFNNEWSAFKSEEIKFIENDHTAQLNQESALDNSFDLFSDTESSEFSVFKKYVEKRKKQKHPVTLVAKRNERERMRVRAVNESFNKLRNLIPSINYRKKRTSKVKTIQKALEYIALLQKQLNLLQNYP
ncbi:unnamed protein product [Diamesa hyperborea]